MHFSCLHTDKPVSLQLVNLLTLQHKSFSINTVVLRMINGQNKSFVNHISAVNKLCCLLVRIKVHLPSLWKPSRQTTMTDMRRLAFSFQPMFVTCFKDGLNHSYSFSRSVVTGVVASLVPNPQLVSTSLKRQKPRNWQLSLDKLFGIKKMYPN